MGLQPRRVPGRDGDGARRPPGRLRRRVPARRGHPPVAARTEEPGPGSAPRDPRAEAVAALLEAVVAGDWLEGFFLLADGIVARIPASASLDAVVALLGRTRAEVVACAGGRLIVSESVVEVLVDGIAPLRFHVEDDDGTWRITPGAWRPRDLGRRLRGVRRRSRYRTEEAP